MESQGKFRLYFHARVAYPVFPQAKLKSLHETVVRNRLEQLRKRQRDEAFQAQSELLAAAASRTTTFGGDMHAGAGMDVDEPEPETKEKEDVEPYERGMSPELIDISKLPYEERQVEIIDVIEDLVQLVRCFFWTRCAGANTHSCEVRQTTHNHVYAVRAQGV